MEHSEDKHTTTSSRKPVRIGDIVEQFGQIVTGYTKLIDLPLGIPVSLCVIIASGVEQGPTFLITSNIHGDEVNPVIIVHRFLEKVDLKKLKGTLIVFPSLNPTGHLIKSRFPLFEPGKDPNRCWPEYKPKKEENNQQQKRREQNDVWHSTEKEVDDEPGTQERCFKVIAEVFESINPSFHVDLHTFSTLSVPFTFLDRIIFNNEEESKPTEVKENERRKGKVNSMKSAQLLWEKTQSMVDAIGLTVLRERPPWLYVKSKLHRSTSGWTLNYLSIPSCTIELGAKSVAVPSARDAGIEALFNVLYWGKMLDGSPCSITSCKVIKFAEPHRYLVYPQAEETGIVDYQIEPGDMFKKNDLLVIIRNIEGKPIARIEAKMDGYLMAWNQGVAKYKKNNLGMVAVADGSDVPCIYEWKDIED